VQVLLCVADDGAVYPYSVDGELLPWQTSLGSEAAAQGVADARFWAKGLCVLTHAAQLFAARAHGRVALPSASDCAPQLTDLREPRVQHIDVPPLPSFPHAFAGAPLRALADATADRCACAAQCSRLRRRRTGEWRRFCVWTTLSGRWRVRWSAALRSVASQLPACTAQGQGAGADVALRPSHAAGGYARR
jgi:hypothetical protein